MCYNAVWAALALMLSSAAGAQVDPSARAALDAIARAYRELKTLQQETSYSASGTNVSLVSARLAFQKPNLLLLEVRQNVQGSLQPILRRYVCDGRTLYAYDQSKNQYTQEKAPRNMAGFRYLATSLEMAAVTGVDPFAGMERQVRSAGLGRPEVIDGVLCDDVTLHMGTPHEEEIVHIFAGQQDHLVRRFTLDAADGGVVSGQDKAPATWSDGQPLPGEKADRRIPVHFEYESRVRANEKLPAELFRWIAPAGAMRYNPGPGPYTDQQADRKSAHWNLAKPVDLSRVTQPSDLRRPTKTITAKELVDRAVRRQQNPK